MVCQECLEHVNNVVDVIIEIKRILKQKGIVIATVPLGNSCDCDGHVRTFCEESLYCLFHSQGFKNIKILKIPYLNTTLDENLFITACK